MKLFHAGKHPHWTPPLNITAEHHRWTAAHSMRRHGPPLRRAACIFGRKKMMNHDYQVQIIVQLNSSELNILIAISGVISLNLFFWIIRSHLEWRTKRCVTALPRCSPTLVQNAYSECPESVRSLLSLVPKKFKTFSARWMPFIAFKAIEEKSAHTGSYQRAICEIL